MIPGLPQSLLFSVPGLFMVAVLSAFALVFFWYARRYSAWEKAAKYYGLNLGYQGEKNDVFLSGQIRGRSIYAAIDSVHETTVCTRVRTDVVHRLLRGAVISRRGNVGSAATLFQGQEFPIDFLEPGEISIDKGGEFDRNIRIRGASDELLAALKREAIQAAFDELLAEVDSFSIRRGRIEVLWRRPLSAKGALRTHIEWLLDFAEKMERLLEEQVDEASYVFEGEKEVEKEEVEPAERQW